MNNLNRIRFASVCFLILFISAGCRNKQDAVPRQPIATGTISVDVQIVDADDSVRRATVEAMDVGSTVADAMRKLQATDDFSDIQIVGDGEMTFVQAIGDRQTAGGEGWTFYVNGQWAKQGIGSLKLADGDRIEWKFGTFAP